VIWWGSASLGRTDSQIGVKEIGQADAIGLGGQTEKATVGIEPVGAPCLQELETVLLAAIDEALAHAAVHPEDEIQGVRAKARNLDDLRYPSRIEAAQARPSFYVLKVVHRDQSLYEG
jgi:hypothetical protein